MSVDLKKLKEKLANLKDSGSGSGSVSKYIFKPTSEQKVIRIVPYMWCKDDPFQEIWQYYNLKKGSMFVSPRTIGKDEDDPVIAYAQSLMYKGGEIWKKGKDMMPKLRIFVPVIVRGEESEGVKFWGFGQEIYKKLLETFVDPEYNEEGDITDLKHGRDIVVWTEEIPGKSFVTPNFKVKLKMTPFIDTDDTKLAKKILTEQPKLLGEIYKVSTKEELEAALDLFMNPDKEDDTYEVQDKTSKKTETKKTSAVAEDDDDETSVEDILAEFDQD